MVNRRNDINNEIAYFYTVIKNMDTKDKVRKSKIKEYEILVDEIIYDNFLTDFDMDKQTTEQNLLGWIDLIENENLHKAVKSLSNEDPIFISYIVKECLTQKELALKYGVNQASIGNKLKKILRILKIFLSKK